HAARGARRPLQAQLQRPADARPRAGQVPPDPARVAPRPRPRVRRPRRRRCTHRADRALTAREGSISVVGEAAAIDEAFVYLLRCADGSLYCGWTTDVARRVAAHAAGRGGRYTASRLPI